MKHDYWTVRSGKYNKLKWVTNEYLLNSLIDFCDLQDTDVVMEAGCGTGIVSKAIVDKVACVVASDYSIDMLQQMNNDMGIITVCQDLQEYTPFICSFDKIIGRMVFHHINDLRTAFSNCHQMLKPEGRLIIQEGVPPSEDPEVVEFFTKVMTKKEERNILTKDYLINCFKEIFPNDTKRIDLRDNGRVGYSGYSRLWNLVEYKEIYDKEFSVNNWLVNSNQPKKLQKEIYDLHLNASEKIKDVYRMVVKDDGEIIMQTKVLLIKGVKNGY